MYRIGRLAAANKPPVSVLKPDDTIDVATSLMLMHDFSQLPVMASEKDVKGVINWVSVGSTLALGKGCKVVNDCMVPHKEISYDTYIFAAVNDIIDNLE